MPERSKRNGYNHEITHKFSCTANSFDRMGRTGQNRSQGMKSDEWCQLHDITKAGYYWRLRKVREAYLKTTEYSRVISGMGV